MSISRSCASAAVAWGVRKPSAIRESQVGRDEVGADPRRDLLAAVGARLRDTDPVDVPMPGRDLTADEADPAGADDREADALGRPSRHFGLTG